MSRNQEISQISLSISWHRKYPVKVIKNKFAIKARLSLLPTNFTKYLWNRENDASVLCVSENQRAHVYRLKIYFHDVMIELCRKLPESNKIAPESRSYTLLALITPALSQRRPILRRPLFRQEQISTYRHLGPLLTPP